MMPPEIVGEKMEPEQLYDAVNVLISLQVTTIISDSHRYEFELHFVAAIKFGSNAWLPYFKIFINF